MDQDSQEEGWIEHCNGSVETRGETPRQGLTPIGRVIDLAGVLPPSVNEELVAVLCLDIFRLVDFGPWYDRECVTRLVLALLLHFEARLLGHGSVKDAVSADEDDKHEGFANERELVSRGGGANHVDDGVTIGEWTSHQHGFFLASSSHLHSSHVPEDEHPSKLFVEHVPSLRDHVLSLGTSVDIETCGKNHVCHVVSKTAKLLVLFHRAGQRNEKEQDPRDSDFCEHLQVDGSNTGVERNTHKVVVDPNTAQSEWFTAPVEKTASDLDEERTSK